MPMSRKDAARERYKAKEAMKAAWQSYKEHAWGHDFLKPQTLSWNDDYGLGVTIIDALDTLIIMGLHEEYKEAKEWIEESLQMESDVSFFETVIRCLGGLISAYELTGDKILLEKAKELGDRLMPAFNTTTGLPKARVDLGSGRTKDHHWAPGSALLADVGTCQMELIALTEHTGDFKYAQAGIKVFDQLRKLGPLPPTHINIRTLECVEAMCTFDAFGDSYYEYLLKSYAYAPKNVSSADEFWKAIWAAVNRIGFTGIESGRIYFTTATKSGFTHNISHLVFFLPGLLYLAASVDPRHQEMYNLLANQLLETGMMLYDTRTGIGGETASFTIKEPGVYWSDPTFKLRPEFVESLFYAWRFTHDKRYRVKAKKILDSILKYCRINGGFTTVEDVTSPVVIYGDLQDSFFLSETLKYLYLIFCDDDVISLDKYVFTTQAHPLLKLRQ